MNTYKRDYAFYVLWTFYTDDVHTEEFARERGMIFLETSPKAGVNVDSAFLLSFAFTYVRFRTYIRYIRKRHTAYRVLFLKYFGNHKKHIYIFLY